jgi:hypothetical protein
VPLYLLCHRHDATECGTAFAAWKGFNSPLRHHTAWSTCRTGGHRLWWAIDAESQEGALSQLPRFLAVRTEVLEIGDVEIP